MENIVYSIPNLGRHRMPLPVPLRDAAAALLRDVLRPRQGSAQAARLRAGVGRR